jgi:hypothetical protein
MTSSLCQRLMSAVFPPIRAAVAAGVLVFMVGGVPNGQVQAESGIVVNGAYLSDDIVYALTQAYGPIAPGRYWYDPISGYVGLEGGPSSAQIEPYLQLGGPLRADASGGGTYVFINDREIHTSELAYLISLYGTVEPGRYWLGADGIGGIEGGPPAFDLNAAANQGSGGGGGGGGGGSTIHSGDGQSSLSTGSDGCTYFSSGGISASTC